MIGLYFFSKTFHFPRKWTKSVFLDESQKDWEKIFEKIKKKLLICQKV